MTIKTPDLITTLSTDREEICKLMAPHLDKLEAGKTLTPQEHYQYMSYSRTYAAISNEIDSLWEGMAMKKQPSLIKRLFRKN